MDEARGCLSGAAGLFLFPLVFIGWGMMTLIPLIMGERPIGNTGLLVVLTIACLIIWQLAGSKESGPSAKLDETATDRSPARTKSSSVESKSSIPEDWARALAPFSVDAQAIEREIVDEHFSRDVLPARSDVFRAFRLTAFTDVRVVILGQDPYPEPGVADGLAFSVRKGSSIPPSLAALFRALSEDPRAFSSIPKHGNLSRWAKQGVLLLNSALTVHKSQAGSHLPRWRHFTVGVLRALNEQRKPIVFLVFGDNAVALASEAELSHPHLVIEMAHPVAWATTKLPKVLESRPFSAANSFLARNERSTIDW